MSTFWSLWVIFFTVVTFIGIFWLMWGNRSSLSRGANEPLEHSYDGIVEHDAPTPLWFSTLFIVLTLFAIGYLVFYPGLGNYPGRSEEHTSELQSRGHLVCRLLLEKKKIQLT